MKHWLIIVLSLIAAAVVHTGGADNASFVVPANTDVCLSQDNPYEHILSAPPLVAIPPSLLQIQCGGATMQSAKLKNYFFDNNIYCKQQAQNAESAGTFTRYTSSGNNSHPKVRAVDIYIYGQRKIVI